MDIREFFSNFSENEVEKPEFLKSLGIDYEKMELLIDKVKDFIDASTTLNEEKNKDIEKENDNDNNQKKIDEMEELSLFFMSKLDDLLHNKTNIQILINNIEKVKNISYSNKSIKVYFRKK